MRLLSLLLVACAELPPLVETPEAAHVPSGLTLREVVTLRSSTICPGDPETAVEITSLFPSNGEVVFGTRLHGACGGRPATVWQTGMSPAGLGGYPPLPGDVGCEGSGAWSEARVLGPTSVHGLVGFVGHTASRCAEVRPEVAAYDWQTATGDPGWRATGLSAAIGAWYPSQRLAISAAGVGGVCGDTMPCTLAVVEPESGERGPSLWAGAAWSDGGSPGPLWEGSPLLDLSGETAPVAATISAVSRNSGPSFVATAVDGLRERSPALADGDCTDEASPSCARPRLLRLEEGGSSEVWRGAAEDAPVVAIGHGWPRSELAWAVTGAPARVLHLEGAALVEEEEVGALLGPLEPSFLAVLNQDDRPTTLFLGGRGGERLAWRCVAGEDWVSVDLSGAEDDPATPGFDEGAILAAVVEGDTLWLSLGRFEGGAGMGRIVAVDGVGGLCP